nr:DoxX family protein [Acidihalobacter aeolianus]
MCSSTCTTYPCSPPVFAAYFATGIELAFPVLLVLGLGTRFAAGFLFVYNIIVVVSYPALWPTGFTDHKVRGLMLLVTLLHGPGVLSLDALLRRWRTGGRQFHSARRSMQ